MNKLCCSLLLLLPLYVNSQFLDDFSDGDFNIQPAWTGDVVRFEVDSFLQLHLKDTAAGESFLSTPSSAIVKATWEFLVRLDFNPSSSNLARVYLAADTSNLLLELKGYYVEIGNSKDEVSLFRQNGSTRNKIIDGKDKRIEDASVVVRIRVTRDDAGNWELFVDSTGGFDFLSEGMVHDDEQRSYDFFGVYCKYTVTRADKFYFDDFIVTGNPFTDTISSQIKIHDVIINEILADPEPRVNLPESEFLELYNRSDFAINLNGWTIADASGSKVLEPYIFQPGTHLILCHQSSIPSFESLGNTMGLSSFPSLNNDGDELSLWDKDGTLMHYVPYTVAWYKDNVKDNGGYSLELIDPNNPCGGIENWAASKNDNGGSPGKNNSILNANPDETNPALLRASYVDSNVIDLHFSESMDSFQLRDPALYSTAPSLGKPLEVIAFPPEFRIVRLLFDAEIQNGIIYELAVSGAKDCFGNTSLLFNNARFGRPLPIDFNDLVINEILFNPKSGGNDFVELFNRSEKVLDLKDLYIFEASIDEPDTLLEEAYLGEGSFLCFPGDHIVLTDNRHQLTTQYVIRDPRLLMEVNGFPNFPDDEGLIRIFSRKGGVIDELQYSKNWHFELLADKNAVSLERLSPDGQTQDPNNWHSAASTAGYATPTYFNSQLANATGKEGELTVFPKVFTPDQDGYHDYVQMTYRFELPGFVGNLQILDSDGRVIRHLIKNQLLGVEGSFTWDGLKEGGEKSEIGIYLVYFEAFRSSGEVKKFIENIVIGGKF